MERTHVQNSEQNAVAMLKGTKIIHRVEPRIISGVLKRTNEWKYQKKGKKKKRKKERGNNNIKEKKK